MTFSVTRRKLNDNNVEALEEEFNIRLCRECKMVYNKVCERGKAIEKEARRMSREVVPILPSRSEGYTGIS